MPLRVSTFGDINIGDVYKRQVIMQWRFTTKKKKLDTCYTLTRLSMTQTEMLQIYNELE